MKKRLVIFDLDGTLINSLMDTNLTIIYLNFSMQFVIAQDLIHPKLLPYLNNYQVR